MNKKGGKRPGCNFWTFEKTKQEALKYETRKEFKDKSVSAYNYAINHNIIDKISKHFVPYYEKYNRYNFKWSKEKCQKEALKYNKRKDFQMGSRSAYSISWRNNWLKDICKHMIPVGNLYKRCIYCFEFPDNHVYVGLAGDHLKRKNQHIKYGPVFIHLRKTKLQPIFKQLTKYVSVKDAQKQEGVWQRRYKREGWIALHKATPGALGWVTKIWTEEQILKCSLKCKSKSEFRKKFITPALVAKKLGIYEKITSHMTRPPSYKKIPVALVIGKKKIKFSSIAEAGKKLGIRDVYIGQILLKRYPNSKYKFEYLQNGF